MSEYRVWQVKLGETVVGSFPENVICEFILIGRIGKDHLVSIDGHAWQPYAQHPEIVQGIERLMGHVTGTADVRWGEERLQATLRYFDQRKRPDRRSLESDAESAEWQAQRTEGDRRRIAETVEQHAYRHTTAEVDNWLEQWQPRAGRTVILLLLVLLAIAWAIYHFQASEPIRVDLKINNPADCAAMPKRGVNWHGCDKAGYLLAGADLRVADLSDANLTGANLSYADLSGARLDGALLTGATWIDGRICKDNSVGTCR